MDGVPCISIGDWDVPHSSYNLILSYSVIFCTKGEPIHIYIYIHSYSYVGHREQDMKLRNNGVTINNKLQLYFS